MCIQAFIIAALLLWASGLQAATIEQQRNVFQQARAALDKHHIKHFHQLKDQLDDYPLTPYLDIWHARRSLKQGDDSLVAATLLAHADVPETIDLRRYWLKHLAKKAKWSDVQRLIGTSPRLASRFPDIAMMAHWMAGDKQYAMQQFSKHWQQGKTTTSMLKPLYRAWRKQAHPTDIERWQRIAVFAKKRHWKRAHTLAGSLSKQKKSWLYYWQGMQKDPDQAFQSWPKSLSQVAAIVPATLIIKDGIKRLSRRDVLQAWKRLQQLKTNQKQVDAAFLHDLERSVALRAAKQHKPDAMLWLASLPVTVQNKETRAWQIRLAIIGQNWVNVLSVIESMRAEEKQQDRWIYWQAKALEAVGKDQQAKDQWGKIAAGRGYYNFLSAEQLGQKLQLTASDIVVDNDIILAVEKMPGIRRADEWLQLQKRSKAIREWHFALHDADKSTWKAAAVLASTWHWDDQVIRAAFKADELDALSDRFPMSYKKIVLRAAKKTGLEAAEIWSIIRQESAFNQHAVSHAGAKGLMQLMPATARQVAHQLKMSKSTPRLFSAAVNIRLGTTYLADIKRRFGNLALAAAGYNAGPHRVASWLKRVSFDS
ncbi:MAG: transglycosylase SLT domain-containing protein, partial [Mariprofundus sp.]|nr:transglycosylase SLT domain-containing protein [Mariprofundus sp.]